jgi:hypothetical protein
MTEWHEGIVSGQEKRTIELQAFWAMQDPNTFADMSKSMLEEGLQESGGGGKGLR